MHTFSPALGKQIIEQMFGTLMIFVYIGYHYILLTNSRRLLEGSTHLQSKPLLKIGTAKRHLLKLSLPI